MGAGAPDGRPYEELFAEAREFLEAVEDLARSHRIKALVEIHHRTICPSTSLAHRLVSAFDPEFVGVIFDPGNMAQESFEDYRIGAELLGSYLLTSRTLPSSGPRAVDCGSRHRRHSKTVWLTSAWSSKPSNV